MCTLRSFWSGHGARAASRHFPAGAGEFSVTLLLSKEVLASKGSCQNAADCAQIYRWFGLGFGGNSTCGFRSVFLWDFQLFLTWCCENPRFVLTAATPSFLLLKILSLPAGL